MKKITFLLIVFCLCASTAYAHPPSKITLSYDKTASMLNIDIVHPTSNMNNNYIRLIEVTKNNETPIMIPLHRQPSAHEFSEEVPIDAKAGDTINIKAMCSKGGMGTASLVVKADEEQPPEGE